MASDRTSSDRTKNVLWFAAGLSLGAAVGLLAAPAPGAETRRYLADNVDRGKELYDRGRELADQAASMYEEGRRLVEDQ